MWKAVPSTLTHEEEEPAVSPRACGDQAGVPVAVSLPWQHLAGSDYWSYCWPGQDTPPSRLRPQTQTLVRVSLTQMKGQAVV